MKSVVLQYNFVMYIIVLYSGTFVL